MRIQKKLNCSTLYMVLQFGFPVLKNFFSKGYSSKYINVVSVTEDCVTLESKCSTFRIIPNSADPFTSLIERMVGDTYSPVYIPEIKVIGEIATLEQATKLISSPSYVGMDRGTAIDQYWFTTESGVFLLIFDTRIFATVRAVFFAETDDKTYARLRGSVQKYTECSFKEFTDKVLSGSLVKSARKR